MLKKIYEVRRQSKMHPHGKIKKRKKGTWTKLGPLNVNSSETAAQKCLKNDYTGPVRMSVTLNMDLA